MASEQFTLQEWMVEPHILSSEQVQQILEWARNGNLLTRKMAEKFLLQNYPELVKQNYWLNMQIASRIYQRLDWEDTLSLIKLTAVLEQDNGFYLERHSRSSGIFASLRREKEWGILFSLLKNSFQHWNQESSQSAKLWELIGYLNEVLDCSRGQKVSLELQKQGQKMAYNSVAFRDILGEETAQVAALVLLILLRKPGGDKLWQEHQEIWQTPELGGALLEYLAVYPVSLALWLEADRSWKRPAWLEAESWAELWERAEQTLQFSQKILQAKNKI